MYRFFFLSCERRKKEWLLRCVQCIVERVQIFCEFLVPGYTSTSAIQLDSSTIFVANSESQSFLIHVFVFTHCAPCFDCKGEPESCIVSSPLCPHTCIDSSCSTSSISSDFSRLPASLKGLRDVSSGLSNEQPAMLRNDSLSPTGIYWCS